MCAQRPRATQRTGPRPSSSACASSRSTRLQSGSSCSTRSRAALGVWQRHACACAAALTQGSSVAELCLRGAAKIWHRSSPCMHCPVCDCDDAGAGVLSGVPLSPPVFVRCTALLCTVSGVGGREDAWASVRCPRQSEDSFNALSTYSARYGHCCAAHSRLRQSNVPAYGCPSVPPKMAAGKPHFMAGIMKHAVRSARGAV